MQTTIAPHTLSRDVKPPPQRLPPLPAVEVQWTLRVDERRGRRYEADLGDVVAWLKKESAAADRAGSHERSSALWSAALELTAMVPGPLDAP